MSKKKNAAAIGAFVMGAAALAITLIIVFSKGSLFDDKYKAILYFEESINGLEAGAPIDFMGVQIGSVVRVDLVVDVTNGTSVRPVTIALEEKRITFVESGSIDYDMDEWIEMLIQERGLRAQLVSQSMLTGKLKIHMLLQPKTPVNRKRLHPDLPEIPTIPSAQASLVKSIEELPLHDIIQDLRDTARGIKTLVNDKETRDVITNLNSTLVRLESTLAAADRFLKNSGALLDGVAGDARPLLRKASASMETLDGTLTNAAVLMATLNAQSPALIASLTKLSNELDAALDDQSPFHTSLLDTLRELQRALQSFSNLTDYLNRYPEALIQGKKKE